MRCNFGVCMQVEAIVRNRYRRRRIPVSRPMPVLAPSPARGSRGSMHGCGKERQGGLMASARPASISSRLLAARGSRSPLGEWASAAVQGAKGCAQKPEPVCPGDDIATDHSLCSRRSGSAQDLQPRGALAEKTHVGVLCLIRSILHTMHWPLQPVHQPSVVIAAERV